MTCIQCGTAKAQPGEKAWGQIHVREGRQRVDIPVCVVHGAQEGEHAVVIANQPGQEINGVEATRVAAEAIDPRKVKGTVFAIPSVNPLAAMFRSQYWPEDEPRPKCHPGGKDVTPSVAAQKKKYNMSPVWPGAKGKRLVNRIAYEVWNRAVVPPHRKASLFIDVHGHLAPSCVYAANAWNIGLGVATGIGIVMNVRSRLNRNITNKVCFDEGIANLTYELDGQHVMSPRAIDDGRRGILNLLKFWGVLGGRPEYPKTTAILDPWRNDIEPREFKTLSYAPFETQQRGLVVPRKDVYGIVRKGEVVCHVTDPFTGQVTEECRAPMGGAIYSMYKRRHHARYTCEKGDQLFAVSTVRRVRTAEYVSRLSADAIRKSPLNRP